jgi:fluoride exporter
MAPTLPEHATRTSATPGPAAISHEAAVALWVGMGGAVGALSRFAIGGWVTTFAGAAFPWGTFAVNVLGSAALGALNRGLPAATSPYLRAFLTVGLCGGFTTFSTFDLEVFALIGADRLLPAAVYAAASATCCIVGVYGGRWFATRWLRARRGRSAADAHLDKVRGSR